MTPEPTSTVWDIHTYFTTKPAFTLPSETFCFIQHQSSYSCSHGIFGQLDYQPGCLNFSRKEVLQSIIIHSIIYHSALSGRGEAQVLAPPRDAVKQSAG